MGILWCGEYEERHATQNFYIVLEGSAHPLPIMTFDSVEFKSRKEQNSGKHP
jgi:hypothetical protein